MNVNDYDCSRIDLTCACGGTKVIADHVRLSSPAQHPWQCDRCGAEGEFWSVGREPVISDNVVNLSPRIPLFPTPEDALAWRGAV